MCRRIDNILPSLDGLEELRLYLPNLSGAVQLLSECAKLRSISLACNICMAEIGELLYWPQLENLDIAILRCDDFVSSSCKVTFSCLGTCLSGVKCLAAFCPCMPAQTLGAVPVPSSIINAGAMVAKPSRHQVCLLGVWWTLLRCETALILAYP